MKNRTGSKTDALPFHPASINTVHFKTAPFKTVPFKTVPFKTAVIKITPTTNMLDNPEPNNTLAMSFLPFISY